MCSFPNFLKFLPGISHLIVNGSGNCTLGGHRKVTFPATPIYILFESQYNRRSLSRGERPLLAGLLIPYAHEDANSLVLKKSRVKEPASLKPTLSSLPIFASARAWVNFRALTVTLGTSWIRQTCLSSPDFLGERRRGADTASEDSWLTSDSGDWRMMDGNAHEDGFPCWPLTRERCSLHHISMYDIT